jgi:hypothetical protein
VLGGDAFGADMSSPSWHDPTGLFTDKERECQQHAVFVVCGVPAGTAQGGGYLARVRLGARHREGVDVAGKKRPKSLIQTAKKTAQKAPAKPKRPKKTSRGK